MLYQAIYSPTETLPEAIIHDPSLSKYVTSFGQDGDYGFVLSADGHLVGAAWTRLLVGNHKGYGFVDDSTPELSMAIEPAFRGKGYGQLLVTKLIEKLRDHSYNQLSLSVDKRNRAINLYRRLGFDVVGEDETTCTMLIKLKQPGLS
jgi:ribosomal protein S18 acetylase RimI-like enzyme